ncbi:MAG: DUF1572 family protein [Rhodopirellula sp.]|nr:DUF1572 family protein [Rhodopirellula sp.]
MSDSSCAARILVEFEHLLNESLRKIRHCIGQLSDEQVWSRPRGELNSVANLLLHLAGNLQQWCVAGIGGEADDRDRDAEFAATGGLTCTELICRLEGVTGDAIKVMRSLNQVSLEQERDIQGFSVTVLQALFHTVPHFVGHTHQLVLMTRMILGDAYQFEWSPDQKRTGVPL